jgi:hypothetical protein
MILIHVIPSYQIRFGSLIALTNCITFGLFRFAGKPFSYLTQAQIDEALVGYGSSVKRMCAPGKFLNAETQECDHCGPGFYKENYGDSIEDCLPCLDSTGVPMISSQGTNSADLCMCPKQYVFQDDGTTTGRCVPCKAGFQRNPDGQCEACPPGSFSEASGECIACSPGMFQFEPGTPCTVCEIGTYEVSTGSTKCTSCPAGATTLVLAATNVHECECRPGFYSEETTFPSEGAMAVGVVGVDCLACPPGAVCNGRTTIPFAAVQHWWVP